MSASRLRPHVLLLTPFDDERQLYRTSLEASGFRVTSCTDAPHLLRAAPQAAAILMRVRQAGATDGIAVTRALRQRDDTRHVPVILFSTFPQSHVRETALAAGCDRYLLLPILPDELAAAVRACLRPPPPR